MNKPIPKPINLTRLRKRSSVWYGRPVDIHIKFKKRTVLKLIHWAITLALLFWFAKAHAQTIQPESNPVEPVKTVSLKQIPTIKAHVFKKLDKKPVPQSKPAVSPVNSSGCVWDYHTGNFYIDYIMDHEGVENGRTYSCATNAGGCFGLLQACPGYPLRAACGGNPACQIDWFFRNKVVGKYGSWVAAYNFKIANGWW